jgi:hypothetical protein
VLPPLASVREQMTGSEDTVAPAAFVAWLEAEIEQVAAGGGYLAPVLHPFMLDWLGEEQLERLLARVAAAGDDGNVEVSRCDAAASRVLAGPDRHAAGAVLDSTSWA